MLMSILAITPFKYKKQAPLRAEPSDGLLYLRCIMISLGHSRILCRNPRYPST